MGNFDWQYVIDGAAALYGLYVLMSALKMKATGEISSFVASPEEMNKCKRKKEFAKMVSAKMIVFGLVTSSMRFSGKISCIILHPWAYFFWYADSLSCFCGNPEQNILAFKME